MNEASPSVLAAIRRAKLTASDGAAGDAFGSSVAVSGDTAVVGADWDDTPGGSDAGSLHVFVRSGTAWIPQAKLTAPDGAAGDSFGSSVAVSGDTAVVGAPQDVTSAGFYAGSAYVFVRSGTAWIPQAKLTSPDGIDFETFGESVALDGDTAVVGVPNATDYIYEPSRGSAYVFVRSGTAWAEQAKLTASDRAVGDRLGSSVAVRGDAAVVGAYLDDTRAGSDAGSAYVFIRSGTAWTQQAKLTASDGATGDHFGWSVALTGRAAVVGARLDDTRAGSDAGSAYVYWG